jgi:hypothetical protein
MRNKASLYWKALLVGMAGILWVLVPLGCGPQEDQAPTQPPQEPLSPPLTPP